MQAKAVKVVVCGGRDYRNGARIWNMMNKLHAEHRFTDLMQGGAPGADALAREWACTHPEIRRHVCKAAWHDLSYPDAVIKTRADGTRYDAKAGPRRNARMIIWEPDMVVAFPGGDGTADMVKQTRIAGIKLIEIVDVA